MHNRQKGVGRVLLILLVFTLVFGIWFVWSNFLSNLFFAPANQPNPARHYQKPASENRTQDIRQENVTGQTLMPAAKQKPSEPVTFSLEEIKKTQKAALDKSLDQLDNATYRSYSFPELGEFQLKDGRYNVKYSDVYPNNPNFKGGNMEYSVAVFEDNIAVGDLNGDGFEDAVVALNNKSWSQSEFRELALMLWQDGKFNYSSSVLLGDRIPINSLSIESGMVIVDLLIAAPMDAPGSMTKPSTWQFKFDKGNLARTK